MNAPDKIYLTPLLVEGCSKTLSKRVTENDAVYISEDLIKAEIERLMDEYKPIVGGTDELTGAHIVLAKLLSFISTPENKSARQRLAEWSKTPEGRESYERVAEEMRKEKSEKPIIQDGLDEETIRIEFHTIADKCFNEGIEGWQREKLIARHFAQWGANHTPLPEDTVLFNKGVEEGKRLMMEEAVEGEVVKDINNKLAVTAKNVNLDGFKFGDKVRIIIVKEDEK